MSPLCSWGKASPFQLLSERKLLVLKMLLVTLPPGQTIAGKCWFIPKKLYLESTQNHISDRSASAAPSPLPGAPGCRGRRRGPEGASVTRPETCPSSPHPSRSAWERLLRRPQTGVVKPRLCSSAVTDPSSSP